MTHPYDGGPDDSPWCIRPIWRPELRQPVPCGLPIEHYAHHDPRGALRG
jgi:hypothetical protein